MEYNGPHVFLKNSKIQELINFQIGNRDEPSLALRSDAGLDDTPAAFEADLFPLSSVSGPLDSMKTSDGKL